MGQKRHELLELPPVLGLYLPTGQDKQEAAEDAPCVTLYVPGRHALHIVELELAQKPTGQHTEAEGGE